MLFRSMIASFLEPEDIATRAAANIDNNAPGIQMGGERVQKGGWVDRECSIVVNLIVTGIII